MPIQPGGRLGAYRIDALLGQGGMGTVYRAFDTTLQRPVAIKVLSEADDQARGKLLAEARAASALDHPNICTVHEVGEADGQPYIVMALVDGKPLSELIPSDGLPPETVIRYGLQIADALAHAHEKGIIHRDLKSQNVVITPEGRAKVLDFGLAMRLEKQDAEAVTVSMDAQATPAKIAGTLAYMAPEVLRGEEVTARSDIWALGVLLYEMAVGRLPFSGSTRTDVVSAIVKEAPTSLPAKISPGLRNIIQHCLTKEPARRYPSGSAAHAALDAIQSDSATTHIETTDTNNTRTRRLVVGLAALAVVALGLGYALWPNTETPSTTVPRLTNPTRLTSGTDLTFSLAWSADSDMLAFTPGANGEEVWVTPLGGQALNRTANESWGGGGPISTMAWSPDGQEIAFADRTGVFVMSALAGAPRRVASIDGVQDNAVWWLGEGTRLAYLIGQEEGPIAFNSARFMEILTLGTGATSRFELPGKEVRREPVAWSPDERFIAYVDGTGRSSDVTQLWILRIADSEATPITDDITWNWSPTWAPDSRSLFFISNRGGSRDLWRQFVSSDGTPDGAPVQVSVGVGMWRAALSPDGAKLAYVDGGMTADVWRVPILEERTATWADAEQVTFDRVNLQFADLSPDASRLAIGSERGGNFDIWVLPSNGGGVRQVTTHPSPDIMPTWSPDGRYIAFMSYRSGNRDIWYTAVDGGQARQVTTHEARDWFPRWSPDGGEIEFASQRDGRDGRWVVSLDGDLPRQTTFRGLLPRWSPDGQWMAFQLSQQLWRVHASGNDLEHLETQAVPRAGVGWSPDGRSLYFQNGQDYFALSLQDRSERQLTDLNSRRGEIKSLSEPSTDGQYLYFIWSQPQGDIWVMDVIQDEP